MKYLDKSTFFHRLDPRTKILLSIGGSCLIVLLKTPLSLLFLFLVILAFFLSIKPSATSIKTTLRMLALILFTTAISQGFFYYFEPRTPLVTILEKDSGLLGKLTGGIALYKEGLIYGTIQSLRMFSAIVMSMVIVTSTYPSDMILGLRKLGVPEKIAFVLTVSIRFLPSLIEEGKRIMIAQRLRGLRSKGIRGNFKSFRYLVIPLTIDSLRHARRIALAAEVRGFTGKRSGIKELRFTWLDAATLVRPFLSWARRLPAGSCHEYLRCLSIFLIVILGGATVCLGMRRDAIHSFKTLELVTIALFCSLLYVGRTSLQIRVEPHTLYPCLRLFRSLYRCPFYRDKDCSQIRDRNTHYIWA